MGRSSFVGGWDKSPIMMLLCILGVFTADSKTRSRNICAPGQVAENHFVRQLQDHHGVFLELHLAQATGS